MTTDSNPLISNVDTTATVKIESVHKYLRIPSGELTTGADEKADEKLMRGPGSNRGLLFQTELRHLEAAVRDSPGSGR